MTKSGNTRFRLFTNPIKQDKAVPRFFLNSGGFSLIEVLAASAMAALIMTMVYAAYSSIGKTIQNVNGYSEFYVNVNLAVSSINRDIANLYTNTNCRLMGDTDKGASFINFVTVSHRDFNVLGGIKRATPVSDINEVGYYLEPDDKFPDLFFLMRRQERGYDSDIASGGVAGVMLENVTGLKIEYRQGNDWTVRWDSKETKRYPTAVRVTLTVKDYDGQIQTFVFISCPEMDTVTL